MKPGECVAFAFRAFSGHGVRTGLSLAGVAIGVAAVVVLTAIGEGAQHYVTGQFASLGSNLLIVVPGYNETTGAIPGFGGAPNDLTIADAEALLRRVPEIRLASPIVVGEESVKHQERSRRVPILGATAELLEIRDLTMERGSFLPAGPWDRGTPVAVLGRKLAAELFPGQSAVGGSVRIGPWRMRVIGILAGKGTHLGLDMDEVAFVPVATGMKMFDRSTLFRIIMQVGGGSSIEHAEERVRAVMIERHDEEDVTILTQDAVVGSLSSILTALTLAVAGIGAISLSVAGVGVMNVMLVTVSERTQEIGLLRAIGAQRRQVLALFLTESALLSLAGGVVGLALGWAGGALVTALVPGLEAHPPAWAVASALALSLAVGVVFGLAPAVRATRFDPITALSGR